MAADDSSRWSTGELRASLRRLGRGLPAMIPALLIVGLLACVLVPLPTVLVDLLLSVSLAGAVLLLVASLRIGRTTDFLDFPSLLLLVTLFRLALNVSTTRLILSQADAGRVVDAFSSFVVRGDLLVGVVMFGIVTVIQYLVIARGAERVAEVAARFALDGMPGYQAAIDADLRAKAISPQEAAQRRAALTDRSSFYGAMDGAVRFVKGDAVAGLVVVAINLLGGIAVGTTRMGLTWQESLEVYGRLTIGDGLLAQIPALLVSLAAGVLVSRVDSERGEALDARTWRWLDPAMLVVPAVLLVGLALVPGMPWLAFSTTGVTLAGVALLFASRRAASMDDGATLVPALNVVVARSDEAARRALDGSLPDLRRRLADSLGLEIPEIRMSTATDLGGVDFVGELDGRVIARGQWTAALAPAPAAEGDTDSKADAPPQPATETDDDRYVLPVFRGLAEAGPELVDLHTVSGWIDRVRRSHPLEARLAFARADERDLLRIARAFARERVPLPPAAAMVRCLAEGEVFRDADQRAWWPEWMRRRLALHWLPDLLEAIERTGPPVWVRPTPDLEDLVLERSEVDLDGVQLRLAAPVRRSLVEAFADPEHVTVVLCSPRARPVFAALLRGQSPPVVVISTAESDAAAVERPASGAVRWIDAPA